MGEVFEKPVEVTAFKRQRRMSALKESADKKNAETSTSTINPIKTTAHDSPTKISSEIGTPQAKPVPVPSAEDDALIKPTVPHYLVEFFKMVDQEELQVEDDDTQIATAEIKAEKKKTLKRGLPPTSTTGQKQQRSKAFKAQQKLN